MEPLDVHLLLGKNPPTIIGLVVQFNDVQHIAILAKRLKKPPGKNAMVLRPIAGHAFVLDIFKGVVDVRDQAQFFAVLRKPPRNPVDIPQNFLDMQDNQAFWMPKTRFAPKKAAQKFGLLEQKPLGFRLRQEQFGWIKWKIWWQAHAGFVVF